MVQKPRFPAWPVAAALLIFSTAQVAGDPPPKESGATQADCTFSNPQMLTGRCNVSVPVSHHSTPRHACEAVLHCINATACAEAQKYCPNPGIARGWKLETAKASVIITASTPRVSCAYSNPAYSGWCRLTVPAPKGMTPHHACEAVVPCMNGGDCPGYVHVCDPNIRSGWKVAEVRPVQPQPTPRH